MDDTTGANISGQASNSDGVGPDGSLNLSIDAPAPMNQPSLARDVGNTLAGLFGISTANAASVSVLTGPSGRVVGFILFAPGITPFPNQNLAGLLITLGARISAIGQISGPGITAGQVNNFDLMPMGVLGITVNINDSEAVDLDNPDRSMTLSGSGVQGGPLTVGFYPGHVWRQCMGLGSGVTVPWPATRTWNATGPNNANGLPVMNGSNTQKMFANPGQQAYLLEEFIAGSLGSIWSLRTGACVVPGITGYAAPGFGQYATFAPSLVLLRATAAGRYVLVGAHGAQPMNVIDPSTGLLFAPDSSLDQWLEIFSGSQCIRRVSTPALPGYTGPFPTAANPGFASGMHGILGVSNSIANQAILSQAAYQAAIGAGGGNSGGPDGGPNS